MKAAKLLLMHEWSGPGRYYEPRPNLTAPEVENKQVAFVTRLPLGEALRRIRAYEDAFKERYGQVSQVHEFKLLAVTDLGVLDDEQLELTRADVVETLAQSKADFDAHWS